MTRKKAPKPIILRDLGGGLLLRRSSREDTEALMDFHARIFGAPDSGDPAQWVADWVKDLMSGNHPTFDVGDFTLVEDSRTHKIVSSMNLISQTWSYAGIEFGVGRPELVSTLPEYRRRGLIRAQFEVIHHWSAQRGHKLQAITGIPWFYRQFGYELALECGEGRTLHKENVPKLKEGEEEYYRFRAAREADLPFITRVYAAGMKRYLVSCVRNKALWHYELRGRSQTGARQELQIVETKVGERIGLLAHAGPLGQGRLDAPVYELKPGTDWLAVSPAVVRHLWATGERYAARDNQEFHSLSLHLGSAHPLYQTLPGLQPTPDSYAFYIRVADLPDFLGHLAPVLEKRLAESIAVGHSGELKLSFYKNGLRLAFEKGRLSGAEPWTPGTGESASFPYLTFLQLVFGYRSLEELAHSYPDCRTSTEEAQALLKILFPRIPSSVWPLD